jgi:hypothetical protein
MARIFRLGLIALLASCATAPSKPPEPVAASANERAVAGATGEETYQPVPEPLPAPATGPAKLTVVTEIGRKPVAAHIKIHGEDGAVLAEGKANDVLTVPPGEHEIEATVTDAQALVDLPTMRQRVTVEAGAEVKERLEFARCQVRVTVNIRGKLDKTAVVTLSRNGTEVAKLTSGAEEYVTISPGKYAASVKSARAVITVSEIALNEGATQSIPINIK